MSRRGAAALATATRDDPVELVDLGPLGDMVSFMVRIVQLHLFQAFCDRFGERGITPGEYSAMVAIKANPGIRQGTLAAAMMTKRSNMTKMVQSLERRDLVRREVPEDDKRSIMLFLTEQGHALIDGVLRESIDHDRETTTMLSVHERKILLGLLGKIVDRFNQRPGSSAA